MLTPKPLVRWQELLPQGNRERTLNMLVLILPFTKSTWVPRSPWKHRQEGSHTLTHVVYVMLKEAAVERTGKPLLLKNEIFSWGEGEYRYCQWVLLLNMVLKMEFPWFQNVKKNLREKASSRRICSICIDVANQFSKFLQTSFYYINSTEMGTFEYYYKHTVGS